jgi:hypothetical protein
MWELKKFLLVLFHYKNNFKLKPCYLHLCYLVEKGNDSNPGKSAYNIDFPGKSQDTGNGAYLINNEVEVQHSLVTKIDSHKNMLGRRNLQP